MIRRTEPYPGRENDPALLDHFIPPMQVPSIVTACKEAYRRGSKIQRQQLRAWMRRVLAGEDGMP